MQFKHRHYVPVLKWKAGEYKALRDVSISDKSAMTPLAEIVPVPWDWGSDAPAKTLDDHLAQVPAQMASCWGVSEPLFVELNLLDSSDRLASGNHPVDGLFSQISLAGVKVIPVTGLDRDAAYQAAVATVVARDGRGVCIRVGRDDMLVPTFAQQLDDLLNTLKLNISDVDLVMDFRAVEASTAGIYANVAVSFISSQKYAIYARSLTVLSGAFHQNLSAFSPGIGSMPRHDWALWRAVLGATALPRKPSFGDYGIAHPELGEIDPRQMTMSANIRYTTDDEWLIFRGRSLKDPRYGQYGQYHVLAQDVVNHGRYCGRAFSKGDDYIHDVANQADGPGNQTSWRQAPTNHHLVFVIREIANKIGP